jgi:transposase
VVELLPLVVRVTEYQVEPTNNGAERALRPAVLWRQGSCGADRAAGSRFAERLLTVVASCRQQGRPLLAFLVAAGEAAVRGSLPPALLPALQGGLNGYPIGFRRTK